MGRSERLVVWSWLSLVSGLIFLCNVMNKLKHYIIASEDDISSGVNDLINQCDIMKNVFSIVGFPPLRKNAGGFEGLARIVVGQQLSVASAEAIWGRFVSEMGSVEVSSFTSMTEASLRACGLSRSKIKTLNAVCDAVHSSLLEFEELHTVSPVEVKNKLVSIHGIGPWTADIYNMFCIGFADAFAPGDLALQYAVQELFKLEGLPKSKAMSELSKCWRPWRGVAARMLWAYYSEMKKSKSETPV